MLESTKELSQKTCLRSKFLLTSGEIWQFGYCYREERQIVQDLTLYQVPNNIETTAAMMVEVLT